MLNFFKPMNEKNGPLSYELYAESEWRILALEDLVDGRLIDPRTSQDHPTQGFFKSLGTRDKRRLKFLMPLDGWFQMIIYPSLEVKNLAQNDKGIQAAITRIKTTQDHGNRVEGGNWPIELDLDACMHL